MEQTLKQRLVGALVLISLAVIFLPLVFDRQQQRIDTAAYSIPEKPAITITAPDLEQVEQEAREQLAEVNQVVENKAAQTEAALPDSGALPDSSTEAADPVAQTRVYLEQEKQVDAALQGQPVTTPVPLADAWIIQVGAFASEPNARSLRDKLKGSGYAAFIKSAAGAKGPIYKVYVGPEIRRAQLEQQKVELERKFNLKTLILKYVP